MCFGHSPSRASISSLWCVGCACAGAGAAAGTVVVGVGDVSIGDSRRVSWSATGVKQVRASQPPPPTHVTRLSSQLDEEFNRKCAGCRACHAWVWPTVRMGHPHMPGNEWVAVAARQCSVPNALGAEAHGPRPKALHKSD